MTNRSPEIVDGYEVLFALRTGVTILMPKMTSLDPQGDAPLVFHRQASDLVIEGAKGAAVLKNMKKDYLEEAVERGFIMLYETKNDEVVRCTNCRHKT